MLIARRRDARGFSLLELAVTLTVLALLLTAVSPSVAEWVRNTRTRGVAESVLAGLQKARTEALRTNESVTFWLVAGSDVRVVDDSCALSDSSASWVVSREDPSGACAAAPSATVSPMLVDASAAGAGADRITVAALSGAGADAVCVRFNGFGRVSDTNVLPADGCRQPSQISTIDITHNDGARRLRVVVSPSGGVRLCDRDVATTDPRACP
jgi:type IV fimbrial biogenesis protein FimT